ncbi:hypothetical protein BDV11DRAFT_161537 [Aspergillus similis]
MNGGQTIIPYYLVQPPSGASGQCSPFRDIIQLPQTFWCSCSLLVWIRILRALLSGVIFLDSRAVPTAITAPLHSSYHCFLTIFLKYMGGSERSNPYRFLRRSFPGLCIGSKELYFLPNTENPTFDPLLSSEEVSITIFLRFAEQMGKLGHKGSTSTQSYRLQHFLSGYVLLPCT